MISHILVGCTCTAYLRCEFCIKRKSQTHTHMYRRRLLWPSWSSKPSEEKHQRLRNTRSMLDSPAMLLKMTELSEALVAVRTGVGFHSGVDADVLSQIAWVGKWFRTMRALVRLCLCVVPNVGRKEGEREMKTAVRTLKWKINRFW